ELRLRRLPVHLTAEMGAARVERREAIALADDQEPAAALVDERPCAPGGEIAETADEQPTRPPARRGREEVGDGIGAEQAVAQQQPGARKQAGKKAPTAPVRHLVVRGSLTPSRGSEPSRTKPAAKTARAARTRSSGASR